MEIKVIKERIKRFRDDYSEVMKYMEEDYRELINLANSLTCDPDQSTQTAGRLFLDLLKDTTDIKCVFDMEPEDLDRQLIYEMAEAPNPEILEYLNSLRNLDYLVWDERILSKIKKWHYYPNHNYTG